MPKIVNWKTTCGGLVVAISELSKIADIAIPEDVQSAAVVIGVFIIALFAKDNNVTGGTVENG